MYVHTSLSMSYHMSTCMAMPISTHVHTHVHTHMHIYVCTRVHTHAYTHVCAHIAAHAYAHVYEDVQTGKHLFMVAATVYGSTWCLQSSTRFSRVCRHVYRHVCRHGYIYEMCVDMSIGDVARDRQAVVDQRRV